MDDDPNKIGRNLQGLVVFGPIKGLAKVVSAQNVDLAVIAVPSAPGPVYMRSYLVGSTSAASSQSR